MVAQGVKDRIWSKGGRSQRPVEGRGECQAACPYTRPVRATLSAAAVLILCLAGAVALAQQEGAGADAIRSALQETSVGLRPACPEGRQAAVIAPEGGSVLEEYAAVMLAFFLKEDNVDAALVRAARVPAESSWLPERIPPERLSSLRATGAAVALAVAVGNVAEGSGVLDSAAYSLEDGERVVAWHVDFSFSEDLSFLDKAKRQEIPASDSEWLDLLQRIFPSFDGQLTGLQARLAWVEGKYFFGANLWEQAAQRLRALDSWKADDCLLRLAFSLQQAGQGAEALKYVEDAINLQPDSGPLFALKGWLVLRAGQPEDALALLEEGRRSDMSREGFYWLGRHLLALERGKDDFAEQYLVKGADLLKNESFAQLKAARYYWRKAKLETAAEFYRRALNAGDSSAETWMELGTTLDAAGKPQEALDAFRQAFAIKSGSLSVATKLFYALKSLGQHEEALEVLGKASEARPDRVELLAAYADAAAQMWRTPEAEAAYARTVRLDPQFYYGSVGRAEMLARQGRYEEAQQVLSGLLEAQPDYQRARLALARMLADQGRTDGALQMLAGVVSNPDNEVGARLCMSDIQCRAGRYDEAVLNAQKAVMERPDVESYAALARALTCAQQWENAESAVKKALETAPSNPVAHLAAARLASARGQHEQALALANQALERSPYSVDALVLAGQACLHLGRPGDCADFWERAAALDRWNAELQWQLAEVLRTSLDEPLKASEHYRKHISLQGAKSDEAARLLERLQAAQREE